MAKDIPFPEPVSKQGVTEEIVGSGNLPDRQRYSRNRRNQWSFRLKDGRYAYIDYRKNDGSKNPQYFYHVLSIDDDELMDFLDSWDKNDERGERSSYENKSFAYLNYEAMMEDNVEDTTDPASQELYRDWAMMEGSAAEKDPSRGKQFPLKAEYAIVHSLIQQLTANDRKVFELFFNSNMTEMDIKKELDLNNSQWSNEKNRFLEKVRSMFITMGYDVPTVDELNIERNQRENRLKKAAEYQEKEVADRKLGQSISRELNMTESSTHSRAFVDKDKRLQSDIEQMIADDLKEVANKKGGGDDIE